MRPNAVTGRLAIDMCSRQCWLKLMAAGTLPANRLPPQKRGNRALLPSVEALIDNLWDLLLHRLAACAEVVIVVGVGRMESYEAIAVMPKAIRVFQPVYRARELSWPSEAMLVRCLQQLDMID